MTELFSTRLDEKGLLHEAARLRTPASLRCP